MTKCISSLRGINVTGQKKIKMKELGFLYKSLGFTNVQTYIQSGNVIFECAEADLASLVVTIESGIKQKFGYDVSVLVTTPKKLRKIIDNNPYDENKIALTFLFETPKHIPWEELNLEKDGTEQFEISDDVIYFNGPQGYGRTKLSNNFFEKKLKVIATTRNSNTINRLLALSE